MLRGEELSCYRNNIPSVGLQKCTYDHYLANEAHFSGGMVKNIYETRWRRKTAGIEITSLSRYVLRALS